MHAYNLPVFSDDLTQGAADFIASINGKPYHIELTCKYYGSDSGKSADLCGLNPKDTLAAKAAKLPRQLTLLQSPKAAKPCGKTVFPTRRNPPQSYAASAFSPSAQIPPKPR